MKKITILTALIFSIFTFTFAQKVPQGMKYQAVARDAKGEIYANEKISLKINLVTQQKSTVIHYSETHNVVTSQVGLFTLVIGEGTEVQGAFDKIPWSTDDIWMQVSIKDKSSVDFSTISNSKLLAVPYAFHAATASELTGKKNNEINKTEESGGGVPSQVWHLKGNSRTDATIDKLGTTDYEDLVIVTNNLERLRITKDGDINLQNALNVGKNLNVGGNVTIDSNLTVKENVSLNTLGGTTIINGPTDLKSSLNVDGKGIFLDSVFFNQSVEMARNLHVGNNLELDSNLTVQENVSLNAHGGTTIINGPTDLKSSLNVDGKGIFLDSVQFEASINVAANLNSMGLNVSNNSSGYVATFENTNDGNGDGIIIKLGKTHPAWDGAAYANIPNVYAEAYQTPINTIRGWIFDHNPFQVKDLINLFPASIIAGTVISITNSVTEKINDALNLPIAIGPFTIVPELDLGVTTIGPYGLPRFTVVPAIPQLPNPFPVLSSPNIEFVDVTNSLTKENEFIRFADKDDRLLGAVRAQSIVNWSADYLNAVYFINVVASMVGIDLLQGLMNGVATLTNLADSYNHIGIEYSSGHGDYAEWLERLDPNESISAGDIVALKGGKITKDLKGAEQIMAVSYRPIMLGNAPAEGKEQMGNKVAFMGQIPVKVMGAVKTGDFIVAKGDIPGYGVAVSPSDMTSEDLKLTVGRSWETKMNAGPKMVNTLVGIQNGDYIQILKKDKETIYGLESRVKTLEDKLNSIINGLQKEQKRIKETSNK